MVEFDYFKNGTIMSAKNELTQNDNIQNRIFTIRGVQVMLDKDLAEMYSVETKYLNRAVNRNKARFPVNFRFQLTQIEFDESVKSLRFQFGTSKEKRGGRRYLPFVFTEQGVAMLSSVLRSETAVEVSIQIMQAFVEMKKFIATNAYIFQRLEMFEIKQIESDQKFNQIFKALEDKSIKPKQGIFYDGQVFDAYVFLADLIKSAKKSILLIDNYIDETVLQLFIKCKENVSVTVYTKNITKILRQDLEKYNTQYQNIEIKKFTKAHDRFLIIDKTTVYHFGASLKDLGKRWFAFSKMDIKAMEMIARLGNVGDD